MGKAFRKFVGDAKANWGSFSVFMPTLTLLLFFVIIPIASVLYGAFSIEEQFTIQNFMTFFENPVYIEGFQNSLIISTFTVIFTSLIGIPLAYVLTRYDFHGKKIFQTLTLIPLVIAPFVGALGLLRILGRNGTFNLLYFDFLKYLSILPVGATLVDFEPFRINFLMGLHGIILVETLHLYPLIYLNTQAALSNIDPSLEEQAKNLGAKGFKLFRTVTFPLMLPGYAAGAILVFVWTFSDLGTPLMLMGKQSRVMATQMFFLYTESGREVNPLALVMCVFMILVSFIFLFAIKKYVSLRRYATISSGISTSALVKRAGRLKLIGIYLFFIFLLFFAVLPHVGVILNSVSTPKGWSFTPLPQEFSLDFWSNLIFKSPTPIFNSLIYSGSAAIFTILLGATIAFLLARKNFPGKNLLDFVAMLPLAVPGLVIGFGYILLFNNTPLDPFKGALNQHILTILIISLTFRRLPFTVRSSFASIQQIHESLEEASLNLGANRVKTFFRISLPLMIGGIIAGGLLAFANSMVEVSTTFLFAGEWREMPLTAAIYESLRDPRFGYQSGSVMGVILIIVSIICLVLVNKVLGERMGTSLRI